jgi:hypothetical protein
MGIEIFREILERFSRAADGSVVGSKSNFNNSVPPQSKPHRYYGAHGISFQGRRAITCSPTHVPHRNTITKTLFRDCSTRRHCSAGRVRMPTPLGEDQETAICDGAPPGECYGNRYHQVNLHEHQGTPSLRRDHLNEKGPTIPFYRGQQTRQQPVY